MVKKADNLRKMIDWVESDLTFSAGKEMILCSLLRYLWTELFIYYIPIASKVFYFSRVFQFSSPQNHYVKFQFNAKVSRVRVTLWLHLCQNPAVIAKSV